MILDSPDQKLLVMLQNGFPLTPEPFNEMGKALKLSEEEVLKHIAHIKSEGVIRQISPVFDARSLGHSATLVAMQLAEDKMDKASRILNEDPHVSHAYERKHHFNLWFTLAMSGAASIEAKMIRIAEDIPADTFFQLPALKLYKIGAFFGSDDAAAEHTGKTTTGELPRAAELSAKDGAVVNELQQDLPLKNRPFTSMANNVNMDEYQFLERCRSLLERGILRRYGAAVDHRRAGYTANAMVCWNISAGKVDKVGQHLASLREVSHCYERKTNSQWPYNLFAMIHGKAEEICHEIAGNVSEDYRLEDFLVLFSTRELKKSRIKYLV